jgi:type III secretion system needle length determinant
MQNKTRIPNTPTNVQHDTSDYRSRSNKQYGADNEHNPKQKDKELSLFRNLMKKQPALKDELMTEIPIKDIIKKSDKESREKSYFNTDKNMTTELLKTEQLNEEVRQFVSGDQILKSLSSAKPTNMMNNSNETVTKLVELIQGLVSKMWVGQSGKTNQNQLTMKLDQALLPNTTITLVHTNGQLNLHLSTPSEASYQLLMSQHKQLISRLEKRKFAEHVNVKVSLIPQTHEKIANNFLNNSSLENPEANIDGGKTL